MTQVRRPPALLALLLALALATTACTPGEEAAPPTADAGPDQEALVGETVRLDGSGSTAPAAPDGPSFTWTLASVPEGSEARLNGADGAEASFVPDVAGSYEVRLRVSDGDATAEDRAAVTATAPAQANLGPVADAGPPEVVAVGDTVTLDGSASHDPDEDALSYAWRFVTWPDSATDPPPELGDADGPAPSFVAASPGDHTLELEVSDGEASATDRVTIRAEAGGPTVSVYASPDGDDANPGTEDAPVRTVARALALAEETDLLQVRLEAGTYDGAPDGHVLTSTLRITGAGAGLTILDGGDADLLTLEPPSGASDPVVLYLEGVTLRTDGIGVDLPEDTEAHLRGVACDGATPCVRASMLFGLFPVPGGVFTFRDGSATGGGTGSGFAVAGRSHLIEESRVEGYDTGVFAFAANFVLNDVELSSNGTGLVAAGSIDVDDDGDVDPVVVRGGSIAGNGTGVAARQGGTLRLENVTIEDNDTHGIRLEATGAAPSATVNGGVVRNNGTSGAYAEAGTLLAQSVFLTENGTDPDADLDRAGLFATGDATVTAIGGGVVGNGGFGMVVRGDSLADLRGWRAAGTAGDLAGVFAMDRSRVRIQNGVFVDNPRGILGWNEAIVTVSDTLMADHRVVAIEFGASGELRVRGSTLQNSDVANVLVYGRPTIVDLGLDDDSGGNVFRLGSNTAWNIDDRRASLSGASGAIIEAHGNRFYDASGILRPMSGMHVGPAESPPHWRIEGTNHRIRF